MLQSMVACTKWKPKHGGAPFLLYAGDNPVGVVVHLREYLLVQVMKGCQEGQFEGHKPFGSFECHYQDVCLAIGRLTSNGYLKRDEESSNVLHYVPDNSLQGQGSEEVAEVSIS